MNIRALYRPTAGNRIALSALQNNTWGRCALFKIFTNLIASSQYQAIAEAI